MGSPFLATCTIQHMTQVRSDVELVVRTIPSVGNYGPPSATPCCNAARAWLQRTSTCCNAVQRVATRSIAGPARRQLQSAVPVGTVLNPL